MTTSAMERIPQIVPWLGQEEKSLVEAVLDDNWLTEGPRTRTFESLLLSLTGAPYGVFAPNGTLALTLGLLALGLPRGAEVIVPNSTFVGSATSVMLAGGRPVFVDIDSETLQVDVSAVARAITSKTYAVMPVHLMGASADMDAVMELASTHGLKVIEDAAQGIGVHYKSRHVGTIGDVGCFSFFADKTITTGEGGFVTCRSEEVYERLRLVRNQGRLNSGSFIHPAFGVNFRITDMQAAVGIAQLGKLDDIIERKRAHLARYREALAGVAEVTVFEGTPDSSFVPFRCMLRCERAFDLADHLSDCGVDTRRFFHPMHSQPCFTEEFGHRDDSEFPNSIRSYESGILLPIYPTMSQSNIDHIAAAIAEFYQ